MIIHHTLVHILATTEMLLVMATTAAITMVVTMDVTMDTIQVVPNFVGFGDYLHITMEELAPVTQGCHHLVIHLVVDNLLVMVHWLLPRY